MAPDDTPRSFREVAIMLKNIRNDVESMKSSFERMKSTAIVGLLCPLVVGVVLGFFSNKVVG